MKTTKKIETKARKIAKLIMELREDVIKAEDPSISDNYRAYIMGTELISVDNYIDFANRLDYSISKR